MGKERDLAMVGEYTHAMIGALPTDGVYFLDVANAAIVVLAWVMVKAAKQAGKVIDEDILAELQNACDDICTRRWNTAVNGG